MSAVLEAPQRKFRVLRGIHAEGGKVYGKGRVHGDVVTTTNDLTKHNGDSGPGDWKFLDITHGTPESMPAKVEGLTKENERLRQLLKDAGLSQEEVDKEVPNQTSISSESQSTTEDGMSISKLESMTVQQLKEYAEDNEIDLGEASLKADIVLAIAEALEID